MPWAMKIVDDTLVWAETLETLQERVEKVLMLCRDINITIAGVLVPLFLLYLLYLFYLII